MAALIRILFVQLPPQERLAGSLRIIAMAQKSRQAWLVESYLEEDQNYFNTLIQTVAKTSAPWLPSPLWVATAMSFSLYDPAVAEAQFVVRNSSTGALYGFCATFATAINGHISALFVDPSKRNLSIGHFLYRRAITTDLYVILPIQQKFYYLFVEVGGKCVDSCFGKSDVISHYISFHIIIPSHHILCCLLYSVFVDDYVSRLESG
jgi:hypothetical protein